MGDRLCLDCNQLVQGRKDKKFCNDLCRNNYNNKMNSDSSSFVKTVNGILRKNRKIIEDLNPSGKTKVKKAKMISAGFNFNYYTNVYKTKKGSTYYFCYDKGYLLLEADLCALVNRQDYVA